MATEQEKKKFPKNMKIFAALGLGAGVVLIILSLIAPGGGEEPAPEFRSADFVKRQETKISEMLSRIDGVSEPFVMITLADSGERVYDTDGREPVLIKEIEPRIKGVAVICRGIANPEMQLKIINLVSTVLNLPTNRVYVISAD